MSSYSEQLQAAKKARAHASAEIDRLEAQARNRQFEATAPAVETKPYASEKRWFVRHGLGGEYQGKPVDAVLSHAKRMFPADAEITGWVPDDVVEQWVAFGRLTDTAPKLIAESWTVSAMDHITPSGQRHQPAAPGNRAPAKA